MIICLFLLSSLGGYGQRKEDIIITTEAQVIRSLVVSMDESGIYYQKPTISLDSIAFIPAEDVKTVRFREKRSASQIPDFLVIKMIDEQYRGFLSSSSEEQRASIKAQIHSFYSELDASKEDRVRNLLMERVIQANENRDVLLLWLIEEYCLVTPFNRPGREPLYELLAQFYESMMNLDALEEIKAEIGQYEQAVGYSCQTTRSKVILAIAHAKKALMMGDEMCGFWVSDIYDEDTMFPRYCLYIGKNQADTLTVHLYTNEDIGSFHDNDTEMIGAQRVVFNGIKQEYGFTFATDKIDEGSLFLSNSLVVVGSTLSSIAAKMATIISEDPNYTPSTSFIMNLSLTAARQLAKSKKEIDIIDIYGSRSNSDVLLSRFLHVNNTITAGEKGVDSILEKDIEFSFYRIYPRFNLSFIDEDGGLRGPDTESWTKEMRLDWWQRFYNSQDSLDLLENNGNSRKKRVSEEEVIKAYNTRSYKKLSVFYGFQIF